MNRNFAVPQRRQLLVVVIHQHEFVPRIGKTRARNQTYVLGPTTAMRTASFLPRVRLMHVRLVGGVRGLYSSSTSEGAGRLRGVAGASPGQKRVSVRRFPESRRKG